MATLKLGRSGQREKIETFVCAGSSAATSNKEVNDVRKGILFLLCISLVITDDDNDNAL